MDSRFTADSEQDSVGSRLGRRLGLVTFLLFLVKGLLWASASVLAHLSG